MTTVFLLVGVALCVGAGAGYALGYRLGSRAAARGVHALLSVTGEWESETGRVLRAASEMAQGSVRRLVEADAQQGTGG